MNGYSQRLHSSVLTLDRIFSSNEFRSESFGPAKWLEDGSGYTTLEIARGDNAGLDIVKYEPGLGTRTILVSADQLIPKGEKSPLYIDNYYWSADGKKLLIFTNTRRVWRLNTRGDYRLLDLNTGDDNVHYQGTEELINEFVRYNKTFTMMAYPNGSHGIYEGEGTTRHLYGLLTRFLLTNMPPGAK